MKGKMKAIVKAKPVPGAELRTVDIPKIGQNEVLVKTMATSICGTDAHIYEWNQWAQERIKTPLIFGHEFAGEVVEVGANTSRIHVGDYVSAETHISDDTCFQCRIGNPHICENVKILGVDINGCFAEYVALKESNAWLNSRDLPAEIASIQEPFGNAVHTALSGEIAGNTTAVFGCGPIGLMAIGIVKASGSTKIFGVDVSDYKLDIAKKMGANVVMNPKKTDVVNAILNETEGRGIDFILEMSGSPDAIKQEFKTLRKGGTLAMLGLPPGPVDLDLNNDVIFKAAKVYGISGRLMYSTWYKTAAFLKSGLVDPSPIITHKFALEDFEKGFEAMASGKSGKVILYPSD